MHNRMDLTNKRFGLLTAIEYVGKKGKHAAWRCMCDCGNEIIIRSDVLISGNIHSCGCFKKEKQENVKFVAALKELEERKENLNVIYAKCIMHKC